MEESRASSSRDHDSAEEEEKEDEDEEDDDEVDICATSATFVIVPAAVVEIHRGRTHSRARPRISRDQDYPTGR